MNRIPDALQEILPKALNYESSVADAIFRLPG